MFYAISRSLIFVISKLTQINFSVLKSNLTLSVLHAYEHLSHKHISNIRAY